VLWGVEWPGGGVEKIDLDCFISSDPARHVYVTLLVYYYLYKRNKRKGGEFSVLSFAALRI
jgi:hypothetical protein